MKKGVLIELDKPRTLRYGLNALVTIEEQIGKPLTGLDFNNVSVKDLRAILYAGLFHEDKELTPEKVADLVDEFSSIENISGKLGEAMTLAFGGAETKNAVAAMSGKK